MEGAASQQVMTQLCLQVLGGHPGALPTSLSAPVEGGSNGLSPAYCVPGAMPGTCKAPLCSMPMVSPGDSGARLPRFESSLCGLGQVT